MRAATTYDAWYVVAAGSLGRAFVMLDRRLSRAIGPAGEIIVPPET